MPYKDTEARRQAAREAMRRKREGITNVNPSSEMLTPDVNPSLVTHPDVIKAANELEPHKFNYLGSYYYWNAGTVQEQLRALPPASRIR